MSLFLELGLQLCDSPGAIKAKWMFAPMWGGYSISRTQEVEYWKVREALVPVGGLECQHFPGNVTWVHFFVLWLDG